MSLIRRIAALGAAAEGARRYARNNPDKARQYTEKAARFANERTKGKYQKQIKAATDKLADLGGYAGPGGPTGMTAPAGPSTVVTQVPPTEAPGQESTARPTPYKRD